MVPGLLRLATAGSVDDGKSTLIGRLFLESKCMLDDQLEAVRRASLGRGDAELDLALFTDGLKAEREQRITIDVAYRYFATPRRRFIIADCPGHVQYTRNMVTGASTAEAALILVDARHGLTTQSRRHAFLAALLQIPHLVVAVNKMDLVDFRESVFGEVVAAFEAFATRLSVQSLTFLPISALHGDNVVEPSPRMPWYRGSTLLHHLETVNQGASRNLIDFRLPVQTVLRPHQDFRGFAGRVASGRVAVGDEVVVLPSGAGSLVRGLAILGREVQEAFAGDSVVLTLTDEVDVSRGDLIVRRRNLPLQSSQLDAMVCWLHETPLNPRQGYLLQHSTRLVPARVSEVNYRIDVDTMHRVRSDVLGLNDIGRLQLTTAQPLHFDSYRGNREMGSFILVDPATNDTVAAGMLRGATHQLPQEKPARATNVVLSTSLISHAEREARNRHRASIVWFTGLSGSGKSSLAKALERRLFERGCQVTLLDGDNLRHGLNSDLGFSAAERQENIRRAAEVARLAYEAGQIVLCSFISPFARDRAFARSLVPAGRFFEVFVHCPLEVCRERDVKGLYAKAERGEIPEFTGISSPYEMPTRPELLLDSSGVDLNGCVEQVLAMLAEARVLVL